MLLADLSRIRKKNAFFRFILFDILCVIPYYISMIKFYTRDGKRVNRKIVEKRKVFLVDNLKKEGKIKNAESFEKMSLIKFCHYGYFVYKNQ